jgi:hypothetical protein
VINLKNHKKSHIPAAFKAWTASLLIFFYVFGSHIQNFHEILHGEHVESITHSPKQEEDPCHRNVFHHEENACEHTTHITTFEKCSLCEWSLHSDQWIASNDSNLILHHSSPTNNSVIDFLITDLSIHLCSRAPPVF